MRNTKPPVWGLYFIGIKITNMVPSKKDIMLIADC